MARQGLDPTGQADRPLRLDRALERHDGLHEPDRAFLGDDPLQALVGGDEGVAGLQRQGEAGAVVGRVVEAHG